MSKQSTEFDAVIVGSGPNGLSAGIRLAQEGLRVKILEASSTIGGGTRTQELTEPGFFHDVCSAVHPTAVSSPFFRSLNLENHGLEWIHPKYPFAHPLEDGKAMVISKSLEKTLATLGKDSKNYRQLYKEFIEHWDLLSEDVFGELRIPKHPLITARFGWYGMFSAKLLSNSMFDLAGTKALFAGCAAHSILPLNKAFTASFGLVLGASAHAVGWPFAKAGSASVTKALAKVFESLSGAIETEIEVTSLSQLPSSKTILFDLTPLQISRIAGDKLPSSYKNKLHRFKYGPGVFKMDWALSEPVPWINEKCKEAGTLHLGGTFEEIADSEITAW
ncbi:MAG: NAD(P)/FAD-dependent oxidoreductase, partial [Balneolaceae bacterium]